MQFLEYRKTQQGGGEGEGEGGDGDGRGLVSSSSSVSSFFFAPVGECNMVLKRLRHNAQLHLHMNSTNMKCLIHIPGIFFQEHVCSSCNCDHLV